MDERFPNELLLISGLPKHHVGGRRGPFGELVVEVRSLYPLYKPWFVLASGLD